VDPAVAVAAILYLQEAPEQQIKVMQVALLAQLTIHILVLAVAEVQEDLDQRRLLVLPAEAAQVYILILAELPQLMLEVGVVQKINQLVKLAVEELVAVVEVRNGLGLAKQTALQVQVVAQVETQTKALVQAAVELLLFVMWFLVTIQNQEDYYATTQI
jgi:hypothetical protein